jgi:hypothetical protein
MSDIEFYGNWMFYGGIIGVILAGLTGYFVAKKIGPGNFSWKHYAIIMGIFMFPTVFLPFLLTPGRLLIKIWGIAGATLFGAANYYMARKAQKNVGEFKRTLAAKNKDKRDINNKNGK